MPTHRRPQRPARVQFPQHFRAAPLSIELDCGGILGIVSQDRARVLDVAGLTLLPSECSTPAQAAQVSNANFSTCSDGSNCGVFADCTDKPISPLMPGLSSPELLSTAKVTTECVSWLQTISHSPPVRNGHIAGRTQPRCQQ